MKSQSHSAIKPAVDTTSTKKGQDCGKSRKNVEDVLWKWKSVCTRSGVKIYKAIQRDKVIMKSGES